MFFEKFRQLAIWFLPQFRLANLNGVTSRRGKCPHGGVFGESTDSLELCERCKNYSRCEQKYLEVGREPWLREHGEDVENAAAVQIQNAPAVWRVLEKVETRAVFVCPPYMWEDEYDKSTLKYREYNMLGEITVSGVDSWDIGEWERIGHAVMDAFKAGRSNVDMHP